MRIATGAHGKDFNAPIPVSPDLAICPDCVRELLDPKSRRYGYPFTSCGDCGPRFTVARGRFDEDPRTATAPFPKCADCAREYGDPQDRHFHAPATACPACGPKVKLVDGRGTEVKGDWRTRCWEALGRGKIVAVKGLGGFHLACDARDAEVLRVLRRRKGRPAKPFAVMCRDLDAVRKYCRVNAAEEALMCSPRTPIVVLQQKEGYALPVELTPGIKTLGVMLPYTPLHHLLFGGPFDILVMTSGNRSELPVAKDNDAALRELAGIADYFLLHNREIVNRCDDSLVTVPDGEALLLRRSRGYVPGPVTAPFSAKRTVLGIGGEMNNTFCLLTGNRAFLSQHMGDLDSVEGENNLLAGLAAFQRLLGVKPAVVGYDLHPHYRSSRLAERVPAEARYAVQHHHAHLASCLADNGVDEPAIGVILDGTGYGTDGKLWGFEILTGDAASFKREYHLRYVPLPGGEQAVRNPWRTAAAYLHAYLGAEEGARAAARLFGAHGEELAVTERILARGFNCPLSSGCGRLFDAVSAMLGVCRQAHYEGQAAIELGELAPGSEEGARLGAYPFTIEDRVVSADGIVRGVLADLQKGTPRETVATRFHNTVLEMVLETVRRTAAATGLRTVALSGGSWQNRYLLTRAKKVLPEAGYRLLYHRNVPASDGGLSLGQAVIAYRRWSKDVRSRTGTRD